jgi:predicted O-methyltransferase YrrM
MPAPVQCAQIQWEFQTLLALYRARAPKRVLEIGTFCGGSLYHFLQASQPGTTVVTVDSLEDTDITDNRELFPGWCPEGVECVPIVGDSHAPETLAQASEHAPYDFVFIDGLHTYAAVSQDWKDYGALTNPGSIIGFHDICLVRDYPATNETAGVRRLWREIQESGRVTQEIVCSPGQTEYGIGVVYV